MKKKFFLHPRFRYGTLALLMILLLAAALIAITASVDTLESKYDWRKDYSFNGITTQSESTQKVLDQLDTPVHIYALFTKGDEDLPLMELLNRYSANSDLITWEQTDLSLTPGIVTNFQQDQTTTLTTDSLIVYCKETDRFKILDPYSFVSFGYNEESGAFDITGVTYEKEITEALLYVTQATTPKVRLLTGHQEFTLTEVAFFVDFLESNNFDVAAIDLRTETLAGDELLMILSPQKDIGEDELNAINAFTLAGGAIMVTCDMSDPVADMPNYLSLLRAYGVSPLDGLVVAGADEAGTYYNENRFFLMPYMQATDPTAALIASNMTALILTGARAFETPTETDNSLTVETVLYSGYQAYLRVLDGDNVDIAQQDDDPVGPFTLAMLSRRIQDDGNVSRMFALGSSSLITNSQIYAITYASEFMLEMMQHLLQTTTVNLDIMAKAALRPGLSPYSQWLGLTLIILLPLVVAITAFCVLLPRKHR